MDRQKMVEEFMRAMEQRIPDGPSVEQYPFRLRASLIVEEAMEFCHASGLVVEPYSTDGFIDYAAPDMVGMIDALCDLLYVVYGAASAMGVDITPFFNEVHRSNMAKLGPDGRPIRREDGKVMKPEGWEPPNLRPILERMFRDDRSR